MKKALALSGLLLGLAACGSSNQHAYGEICAPFAQGTGSGDAGSSGDCALGLVCACAVGPGCRCSVLCPSSDAGCLNGYACLSARDILNNSTNAYCLPGDAG